MNEKALLQILSNSIFLLHLLAQGNYGKLLKLMVIYISTLTHGKQNTLFLE